ncbi:MAG: Flp pilus assembly complex ATPase component TadA [Candidatus Omnitrophota bacterium]|nr:MAG: Flp pilus assembly complex ATPase component TadA [Candidatus Omnitrophota bacterium]
MPKKQRKSLGEILVEKGLITAEQLKQAQAQARTSARPLRQILVKQGLISEEDLTVFLSQQFNLPYIELTNYLIDPEVIDLVPEALARKYLLIPILKVAKSLTVAMVEPLDVFALDELRMKTHLEIEPAVASETEIRKALDAHYRSRGTMEEVIESLDRESLGIKAGEEPEAKELQTIAEEPPVIKLVNLMIIEAVRQGASDIHIEPEEEVLKTRFRVDGMLREHTPPPKYLQSAITSRIKIMANLDIAERRAPQDGRIQMKMEGRDIDIRVSCVPTIYGENVVLRLLDRSRVILDLKQLGFSSQALAKYKELIRRPHGIILVCGPTGSGKTTTLYASLNAINSEEKNIITIEDPIEYHLPGIRQMQVNPKVNLKFSSGLRSILRQDPNVIMVGEIRDSETAGIAVQAALTGHLVFSTLHTNDAPGAVARLLDMGVEPFLLSSTLIGVLAQRLVRTICSKCKGKGCGDCLKTGFRGRIGIFELMLPNEEIKKFIGARAEVDEIRKTAVGAGMQLLRQDGEEKVKKGITTKEEVLRVTEEA